MLFYKNLENIIFHRNELFECDELIILSGYIGPSPIKKLSKLSMNITVIYGMYASDGIRRSLHNIIVTESNKLSNVDILYSVIPIHSKCYVWKNKGKVVHALIGSANFSENGLNTPFKEVLAETTYDTFDVLNQYLNKVIESTIKCNDAVVKENKKYTSKSTVKELIEYDKDVCQMPLYVIDKNSGEKYIPQSSGINWGMAKYNGSHVNINDAYIKISSDMLERYPMLFPVKQLKPNKIDEVARSGHRDNDNIEIIWDDGTVMTGLLEGSVNKIVDGVEKSYPKQISTTPRKSELGIYIRKRLGVSEGVPITMKDLESYGRTTIDVSLQGEGIYYFDFSI